LESGAIPPGQMLLISAALRDGGVMAYPTETFYGLGALATSERGIDQDQTNLTLFIISYKNLLIIDMHDSRRSHFSFSFLSSILATRIFALRDHGPKRGQVGCSREGACLHTILCRIKNCHKIGFRA